MNIVQIVFFLVVLFAVAFGTCTNCNNHSPRNAAGSSCSNQGEVQCCGLSTPVVGPATATCCWQTCQEVTLNPLAGPVTLQWTGCVSSPNLACTHGGVLWHNTECSQITPN